MTDSYQVVVGNIGTINHGINRFKAVRDFNCYVGQSKGNPSARCYGEPVWLLKNGEIVREYNPSNTD